MANTDAELLSAWRGGDEDAGRALVSAHMPKLHRFFANKAPNVAADLSQQTFLAALESEQYDETRSFRSYLLGIAHRLLYGHLRKVSRGERAMRIEAVGVKSVEPTPSKAFADRASFLLLLDALRSLPLEQQILLEFFYWEELPIAEVAVVLDIKVGTVKSRLSRARAALKRVMREIASDPEAANRTVESFEDWAAQLRGGSNA